MSNDPQRGEPFPPPGTRPGPGTGGGDPDPPGYDAPPSGLPPSGQPPCGSPAYGTPAYGGVAYDPGRGRGAMGAPPPSFLPFGIVSIVYAAQVNSKYASGDYSGAVGSSRRARNWAVASVVSAVIFVVIIFALLMGVVGIRGGTPQPVQVSPF